MTDATLRLIISLQDKASAGLRSIQGALGSVAGAVGSAAAGFGDFVKQALAVTAGGLIQKGLEGIAGAVGDLKGGLIDGNAEFERYGVQFGVLLGNADAAQQRLGELAQFGASTPFELPQVVRADKILQSFGLHSLDAAARFGKAGTDIRRIAGDTAAGTGADFEEIAGYIGKFASGATGETIARFQELGIVTKAELTKMGLAFDKGGSLIIGSQEDLDKATGVLLQAMENKYGGMMDAQSKTFEGMISNLQDWRAGTLRIIGAPIFEVLREHLGTLLAWLPSQQPRIEAFAQTLAGGLERGIPAAIELARVVISLSRYIIALVRNGDPLNDWLTHLPAGMRGTVQAGGELVATLMRIGATTTGAVRDGLAWLTDTGLPAARQGWDDLSAALEGRLRPVWGWMTGTALPAAQQGWAQVQGVIAAVRDVLQPFADAWGAGGLGGAVQYTLDRFPPLQQGLDTVRGLLQPVADALAPVIAGFGEGGLSGGLSALGQNLIPIAESLNDLRTNLIALGLEGVGELLTRLGDSQGFSAFLENLGLSNDQITTVKDVVGQLGEAFRTAGQVVRDVAGWFQDNLLPALGGAASGFGETLMPHLSELGTILKDDIWPIIQDVGRFIGDNLPGAIDVLSPILAGLLDVGLSGLELALRTIASVWNETLKPAFIEIGEWIENLTGGWDNLARGADRLKGSLTGMGEALRGIANGDVTAGSIAASAGANEGQTAQLEAMLKGFVGALFPGASNIPGFANGVTGFGGGLAVVGERGPELVRLPGGSDVIPAGRAGGGGGSVTNNYITVGGSIMTEQDFIRRVQTGLIKIQRDNGTTGIS